MDIELADGFWAPRQAQLREHTIEVVLGRLEGQGVVDNFRRLAGVIDPGATPRRAMHFCDSDLYKWLEAAVLAGRLDLADPVIDLIEAVQQPDGYVHTHYGVEGLPARYSDLDFGHEHYCFGHLFEAAAAHHSATGSEQLLAVAVRLADHLVATFGPGRDERTDAHPEVELALCRLAAATGTERYVDHAAWALEHRLAAAGSSLDEYSLSGHAVRALYLASGFAEVALATGEERWSLAAQRQFDALVERHAYPTGAVGGRWLGEMVGRPYEQPDAASYTESCAAVAATQFCERVWRLTGDPAALDQAEVLLYNAVPCGVGAEGDTWFYSQPHAVGEVAPDLNPWVYDFDYGMMMLAEWFPARRHDWFLVPCCPPNLARMFASVDRHVAEVDAAGDLLVHLPLACRIRGDGWDVEVGGGYPFEGEITVTVHTAPSDRSSARVRRPGWVGWSGLSCHEPIPADGRVSLPVDWQWWTTDHRVEGAAGTVHLRRGPVVHCLEGVDHAGVDLRDVVVDPAAPVADAFAVRPLAPALHYPLGVTGPEGAAPTPVAARPVPYADWANRGATTMRLRFPT
ncbi:MAG: glycoside hydrolase family 127 protein [Acidimicrobiales bacterium]|nr:glycoside hydrolase family 127 protein [Acidimicrobiales bacterium]